MSESSVLGDYVAQATDELTEANLHFQESVKEAVVHAWREFYQALDTEKVVVTVSLFLVTVILLSPRGSVRGVSLRRRRVTESQTGFSPNNKGKSHHEDGGDDNVSSNRTATTSSTIGTALNPAEEIETDEEKFETLWPTIRACAYKRLVLPPECKLVDVSSFSQRQKLHQQEQQKESKSEKEMEDDDHPVRRLKNYAKHILHLIRDFLSSDYVSAGWKLISLIQYWLRLKARKPQELKVVEEEEDEDASEVGTPVIQNQTFNFVEPETEVKKSTMHRRTSSGSVYETPFAHDENYVGEFTVSGRLSPLRLPRLRSSGKKKDALENYRSPVSSLQESCPEPFPEPSIAPRPRPASPATLELEESTCYFDGAEGLHVDFSNPLPAVNERSQSESLTFFDAAHSRASLRRMHVEVPVPDRNGYILGDDFLPSGLNTPLLVFVNSRSGPQQGQILIGQLRRLLNPIQVWDLADGGPERILESFCVMTRLRILVCGGDGTVSWIISCLEKMDIDRWPPIAILPLGTGNDLARILGWGGGYNNESLILILEQVSESYISLLDRWEMTIEDKKGKIKTTKNFFNYLGVGADAQAALQVHMLRESTPQLFFSRVFNKMWYLLFGAEEAIKESNVNLPNEIQLFADGIEVPLPTDSQGIILLNIDSYSGGVPIWSHGVKDETVLSRYHFSRHVSLEEHSLRIVDNELRDARGKLSPRRCLSAGNILNDSLGKSERFTRIDSVDDLQAESEDDKHCKVFSCDRPSSCQDGKLDVVSVRGTFHLGQIRVGLSNALRLCQASEFEIRIKKKVAVQIDGEPWRQGACVMRMKRKSEPAVMLHRSADESGGVETEMAQLLDWAEERKIIDRDVHTILMREFSRRIESKTRQRRVKSQDNLVTTLKRAIRSKSQVATGGLPVSF